MSRIEARGSVTKVRLRLFHGCAEGVGALASLLADVIVNEAEKLRFFQGRFESL